MATPANNIINLKCAERRREQQGKVESLIRVQTPPDTHSLTAALQTTLELDELIALFLQEMKGMVEMEGIGYRNAAIGITLHHGSQERHRTAYGLQLHDESLGEVSFSRKKPFAEQELAIVEHLLVALLYPLRNGLRYHSAVAAAFRDPLTGVGNRAALEEALPREVELALRHKLSLSMLLIDLDHFKRINDGFGHAVGDCVLRTNARRIEMALRSSDRVFRFGGEEFMVLLPATNEQGARIVAERIRGAIADSSCECDGNTLTVTTSVGAAQLQGSDNQHLLFDKADKALYRAKALGRNQVIVYAD